MKTVTASILALAVAAPMALADNHEASEDGAMAGPSTSEMPSMQGDLIRSRDITGGEIYAMNEADDEGWDTDASYDEVGTDWDSIGEIEDLVLSKDGKIVGIAAEVGGFLDMGDKHVLISVDDVRLVAADDYAFVTRMSEEELEAMESIDEGFWE